MDRILEKLYGRGVPRPKEKRNVMDAEELFEMLKNESWEDTLSSSTLLLLKRLFFKRKLEEIDNNITAMVIMADGNTYRQTSFIDNLRRNLPEAELVCDKYNEPHWVKMENVDFVIDKRYTNFFRFYNKSISDSTLSVAGDISMVMRKINNAMPEWEAEFRAFLIRNKEKIEKYQEECLLEGCDKTDIAKKYLQIKISDTVFLHRKLLPEKQESVLKALNDNGMRCKNTRYFLQNISFKIEDWYLLQSPEFRLEITANKTNVSVGLYSAEVILEIDRNIPQWVAEGKELEKEFAKSEKIKQINENSAKALVISKMHELGCEYKLNAKAQEYNYWKRNKPKELVLEIKLQKNRKLVINIQSNNPNKVRNLLDSLSAYIEAVNNIPMNVKIQFQSVGNEEWLKE
ncbi:MAG: hypothetical protein J6T98_00195 [Salinivirgaceae bacterium]|nr:hypothetical protein [Salinivirgaceae bacterium]